MKNVLVLSLILILGACASSPLKPYDQIPMGADRSTVLESVGSPFRTKRKDGKDIWTYRFFINDEATYREIHLLNNRVVYKGDSKDALKMEIEEKLDKESKIQKPGIPVDIEKYQEKNPEEILKPQN